MKYVKNRIEWHKTNGKLVAQDRMDMNVTICGRPVAGFAMPEQGFGSLCTQCVSNTLAPLAERQALWALLTPPAP